jgi:hypothetical protein
MRRNTERDKGTMNGEWKRRLGGIKKIFTNKTSKFTFGHAIQTRVNFILATSDGMFGVHTVTFLLSGTKLLQHSLVEIIAAQN